MTSKQQQKSEWGDEVLPGVYLLGGRSQFSHPALQAPLEAMDLKQIYAKIDECEDLVQKLMKSNQELLDFFLPANQKQDDDSDDEEEEDEDEEKHIDPNENQKSSSGGGDITSMEALLAMAEQEAQQYLSSDEDEDENENDENSQRKKNKNNKKGNKKVKAREDAAPPKEVLNELPKDIKEAILENLDIIRDQRNQQKELLEHTAVRQHKCGCHRKHGTAANNTEEVMAVDAFVGTNAENDEQVMNQKTGKSEY